MRKILVAIDGSPSSEKALEAAVKLAMRDGGTISAIAVLDRSGDPHLERISERVKAQAPAHLKEILQAAANFARSRGVHLTPLLREGHPADAILACAEQEESDLLVLGGTGGSAPRPGLGGTAEQVSSHSPCIMLVK
jgi:nucleotide-binding universal stress UspA family protein